MSKPVHRAALFKKSDVAVFRPKASDASQDFYIAKQSASQLLKAGVISVDVTNGGYCPNLKTPHDFRKKYGVRIR